MKLNTLNLILTINNRIKQQRTTIEVKSIKTMKAPKEYNLKDLEESQQSLKGEERYYKLGKLVQIKKADSYAWNGLVGFIYSTRSMDDAVLIYCPLTDKKGILVNAEKGEFNYGGNINETHI